MYSPQRVERVEFYCKRVRVRRLRQTPETGQPFQLSFFILL
jgi:hypothetical protein